LHTELSKGQVVEILEKNRTSIEPTLVALDPHENTLGLLHLMTAVSGYSKYNRVQFIGIAQEIILKGNIKQIRIDPKKFSHVCKKFVDACKETKQELRAVKPLRIAISKIAPEDHLTPQHALFVRACISAKCYKTAIPVLDKFVYLIDPKISGVKSEDTRLYFYYGGICYIALKQWDKAIECFETVIAAPAITASAIMVEAYKKLVLASLIAHGEVGSLPRYTNQSVTRVLKQVCTPYEELSTAFSTHALDDLVKSIENNMKPFAEDNNLGLVNQVRVALIDQNIKRLTKTYMTISFDGLLSNTGCTELRDAEARIQKMVEKYGFTVKINQAQNHLLFENSGEGFDTDSTSTHLRTHIHQIVSLHKQIASIDRTIEQSDRFVSKLLQGEKFPKDSEMERMGMGMGMGPMGTMGFHI
jgi:COP9 signalosome complex subunit 3